MRERNSAIYTPTRRDLLGMGLAVLLTSCSRSNDTIINPYISSPEVRPSQAPKTLSPEAFMDQQAATIVLHAWRGLLDRIQIDGGTQLKMEVLNPDVWANFDEIVKTGNYPQAPLRAGWVATSTLGAKFAGEIDFTSMRIESAKSRKLEEVDGANKIKWDGAVVISFLRKYRANYKYATYPNSSNPAFVKNLLDKPLELPKDFSTDWQKEQFVIKALSRDGSWRLARFDFSSTGGSPMLRNFELPSSTMVEDRLLGECSSRKPWCTSSEAK